MDIKDRFAEFIAYKRLTQRRFQASIGVSSSYIRNISNGIGADVLSRISKSYPELNTDWLLTGEGEMLNPSGGSPINQSVSDRHGTSVAGNGNNVNATSALEKALESFVEQQKITAKAQESLIEQQKITAKAQEQIDRLLALLEKRN